MHTPAAALTWELWRRHRARVITIIGLVLGFALVYPKLCAQAGFNPGSPNALDEFFTKFVQRRGPGLSLLPFLQLLYVMFLAGGPALAMMLTLLCVTWMFTFTEFDPKTREIMKFPARLFTLPISTPFLFWWLWLGGMAVIAMLYCSWVYFVPQPRFFEIEAYQNWFAWMTFLALAAWPHIRIVLLAALLFGLLISPAWSDVMRSPILLSSLFVLGSALARVGLQRLRHGQWQGWTWPRPFATMSARAELRGPKRFASAAQARLWFEWRRSARGLCFIAAVLAAMPLVLHLLLRVATGPWLFLRADVIVGLAGYLVLIPLLLHFCFSLSPARTDVSFLMLRPLSNGQMMMAMLKAAAISAIFSWLVVAAALAVLPALGDFHEVRNTAPIPPQYLTIILPGLILVSWRFIAVNLCFVWSGGRQLAGLPVLMMVALYAGAVTLSVLSHNPVFWNWFWPLVPECLACLIAVKILLAFLAFRVCLKRGLLAPSAVLGYLVVWMLLAAALLIPTAILLHVTPWLVPGLLGIVLLIPLARIGFCPITLAWNRHQR
jgi:hypothetical protein